MPDREQRGDRGERAPPGFHVRLQNMSTISTRQAQQRKLGIRGLGLGVRDCLFSNDSPNERFVQRVDVIVEGALTWHLEHGGLSTLPGNPTRAISGQSGRE